MGEPVTDKLLGASIGGRYSVVRRIGRGGMGTVYLARQETLNREVAIKFLNVAGKMSSGLADRFEKEARTVAGLDHPNIVGLYDYGTHEGLPYMVMEYVNGTTVAARIGSDGPFKASEAVAIVRQALDALAMAHAHKVVHRDLKPENLMLVSRGLSRDLVKVLDFGIAKILSEEDGISEEERFTQTGLILGSPKTMSPEQIAGRPVDHRADIYSIGVILYLLIAGKFPFLGSTPMSVLYKHVHDDPPLIPRESCPKPLWSVVEKALSKSVAQRYQSAEEMAMDLDAVADALNYTSRTLERMKLPNDRPRRGTLVVVGAAVFTAVMLALFLLLYRPPPAQGPALQAHAPQVPTEASAPMVEPGVAPESAPTEAAPVEVAAVQVPVKPPVVSMVRVVVDTAPSGLEVLTKGVADDGASIGSTPLNMQLSASAFPYTVRFRREGVVSPEMLLSVRPGDTSANWHFDLMGTFGPTEEPLTLEPVDVTEPPKPVAAPRPKPKDQAEPVTAAQKPSAPKDPVDKPAKQPKPVTVPTVGSERPAKAPGKGSGRDVPTLGSSGGWTVPTIEDSAGPAEVPTVGNDVPTLD